MIDKPFADRFAQEWVAAWNSHDLTRILRHYTDDFEFTSPLIAKLVGEPSGRLKGKAAVGAYWAQGLAAYPNLKFEPISVLLGVNSLAIYYHSIAGKRAVEIFEFGLGNKVVRSSAHYDG